MVLPLGSKDTRTEDRFTHWYGFPCKCLEVHVTCVAYIFKIKVSKEDFQSSMAVPPQLLPLRQS